MFDAGCAVRNLCEIVFAQFFLLLHAKWAMVGWDDLQIIHLQTLPELSLIWFLAQRRRHHVPGAVKVFTVIIDGKEEILRTGFGKGRDAAIARLAHLVEGVGATEMNDVDRRLCHFGDRDRAMHAFGFSYSRTRERVILGRGVTLRQRVLDDLVDDNAILSVHTDQTAALSSRRHGAKDRRVVNQEHAGISHEQFEAGHAFIHHRIHLFDLPIFEFSCDQMKAIIDCALAFGFLVPVIDAL